MTAEEMEIAYCKARRTCMKSFRMWLREHIEIAEEAGRLGLTCEQVQKLTIAAMFKAESEISKELDGGAELISAAEDKTRLISGDGSAEDCVEAAVGSEAV